MKQEIIWIGNICPTRTRSNPNQGRVYDINGICPTLNQMEGGNRQPMILIGGMQKHQAIKTNGICTNLSASVE